MIYQQLALMNDDHQLSINHQASMARTTWISRSHPRPEAQLSILEKQIEVLLELGVSVACGSLELVEQRQCSTYGRYWKIIDTYAYIDYCIFIHTCLNMNTSLYPNLEWTSKSDLFTFVVSHRWSIKLFERPGLPTLVWYLPESRKNCCVTACHTRICISS